MTAIMEYGLLVAGLVVGGAIGWLVAKQSVAGQLIRAEERLRANAASAATTEQRIRAAVETIAIKVCNAYSWIVIITIPLFNGHIVTIIVGT